MPKRMHLPAGPAVLEPPGPERLLSVQEVRRRLGGISRQYLYALTRAGQFPASIQLGTRIFWSEQEVNAWIAARKSARR